MIGLDTMNADSFGRPPVPCAATRPANARGECKMDQWLRRSLSDAHDEVLTEGLPPSWLALIDKKLPRA